MRHLLRALLTSALVATLAVASFAGVASATQDNRNGYSFELYEDMCLDDGSILLCFEVHGRFNMVNQDNGDQIGTGTMRTVSYIVEGGVIASATVDRNVFQSKFIDGVAQTELNITQTRSLTPGQQCVAHLLLKIEGGEIVVDQASMSCN